MLNSCCKTVNDQLQRCSQAQLVLVSGFFKIQNLKNFYLLLQKNPISFLMESSTNKSIELLWVHIQVRHWLMLFLHTLKRFGYKIVHLTLSLVTSGVMLIISLCFVLINRTFRSLPKFLKWLTCSNMSFTTENEKSTIHFHLLKPHQTNIFINKSINPCLLEPP